MSGGGVSAKVGRIAVREGADRAAAMSAPRTLAAAAAPGGGGRAKLTHPGKAILAGEERCGRARGECGREGGVWLCVPPPARNAHSAGEGGLSSPIPAEWGALHMWGVGARAPGCGRCTHVCTRAGGGVSEGGRCPPLLCPTPREPPEAKAPALLSGLLESHARIRRRAPLSTDSPRVQALAGATCHVPVGIRERAPLFCRQFHGQQQSELSQTPAWPCLLHEGF